MFGFYFRHAHTPVKTATAKKSVRKAITKKFIVNQLGGSVKPDRVVIGPSNKILGRASSSFVSDYRNFMIDGSERLLTGCLLQRVDPLGADRCRYRKLDPTGV